MDNETNEVQAAQAAPTPKAAAAIPRWMLYAILGALLAVFAAMVVMIVKPDFSKPKTISEMSDAQREALADKVKGQIAKHMLMPEETPQIVAAEDNYAELLTQGGFWRDLEKGDYILIFSEDPRVLVWRPGKKLVVNVGPIIDDSPNAGEEALDRMPPDDLRGGDIPFDIPFGDMPFDFPDDSQ